jgi:hypothetical protein
MITPLQTFLNRKIIEKDQIDSPNAHIYDRSRFWLGTGTSINIRGVN